MVLGIFYCEFLRLKQFFGFWGGFFVCLFFFVVVVVFAFRATSVACGISQARG